MTLKMLTVTSLGLPPLTPHPSPLLPPQTPFLPPPTLRCLLHQTPFPPLPPLHPKMIGGAMEHDSISVLVGSLDRTSLPLEQTKTKSTVPVNFGQCLTTD